MKNSIVVLLVMGAFFSGNKIYANENSNPSVKPAKKTQVSFDNVNKESKLYIKDSQGQTLYTEDIRAKDIKAEGNYNRSFDFSTLPANDYYFEVDKKAFISIYPFTVEDAFVELHEELNHEIVKPILLFGNNKARLMRNLDESQSIKVEIYYDNNNLVYSENIDHDGFINRIYDFSKSASGDYLFSIEYEGRTHDEYLSIHTIY